jgi:hypothetical protein
MHNVTPLGVFQTKHIGNCISSFRKAASTKNHDNEVSTKWGGSLLCMSMAQQALVGQGDLSVETARCQPVAETATWQHTTITRDRHPCPQRDSNPRPIKRLAADQRLSMATYRSWKMDSFHNNGCVYVSWLSMANASWINHAEYSVLRQTSRSTHISNTTQFDMWQGRWNSV